MVAAWQAVCGRSGGDNMLEQHETSTSPLHATRLHLVRPLDGRTTHIPPQVEAGTRPSRGAGKERSGNGANQRGAVASSSTSTACGRGSSGGMEHWPRWPLTHKGGPMQGDSCREKQVMRGAEIEVCKQWSHNTPSG